MKYNKRLEFLINQYDIISVEDIRSDMKVVSCLDFDSKILIFSYVEEGKLYLTNHLFDMLINIDPTNKKVYVQWLLNRVVKYLKTKDMNSVSLLIGEDSVLINESLVLFDNLKKTNKFKELAKNILPKYINDVTNILNYYDVSYLFTATFLFIERDLSKMLNDVKISTISSNGVIKYEDYKFLVYSPRNLKGAEIFSEYATWCTSRLDNGMFKSYTSRLNAYGLKSELLIFIDKDTLDIFQIHLESEQIKNSSNVTDYKGFVNNFISVSDGLRVFVEDYIMHQIESKKIDNTLLGYYSDALIKLGLVGNLYNMLFERKTVMKIKNAYVLNELVLVNCNRLVHINIINSKLKSFPVFSKNNKLELISLYKNDISYMCDDYKHLKRVRVINMSHNNISFIDDKISCLDPSNGGSLLLLNLSNNPLTKETKNKIHNLLPNVQIVI